MTLAATKRRGKGFLGVRTSARCHVEAVEDVNELYGRLETAWSVGAVV
jgi:hypothetical protein